MPQSIEERRAYHRAWRAANYKKYLAHQNAYARQWRKDNPERAKEKWDKENKKRREANPEKYKLSVRERNLMRNFKMTPIDYDRMLEAQGRRCAISTCRTDKPGGNGNQFFHVDHCHATGKVRGLLCANCNVMLHAGKDTEEFLLGVIAYLRR